MKFDQGYFKGTWMTKKTRLDLVTIPRDEAIDLVMKYYGFDRGHASFIVAMERGEVKGDVVIVDEVGNEVAE